MKKQAQGVKGAIYWWMDGNRRYEVVTSCDHLHGSHASYSDQTQMLGHNINMILCDVLWIHDEVYSASSVHGVSSRSATC